MVGECPDLKFTVLHLIEGEEYYFRVRAVNELGRSEPNETTTAVRAERPPGKEQLPTCRCSGKICVPGTIVLTLSVAA